MTAYLLKSGLSLLLAAGFYHIWLENEQMHRFKRVYLLASLLFSAMLPFLAIDLWRATGPLPGIRPMQVVDYGLTRVIRQTSLPTQSDSAVVPYWVGVYALGTAVMLARFARNLYRLVRQISRYPNEPFRGATLVRIPENGMPYTFLTYLFVDEAAYSHSEIETELFTHELAHIRQRHSLDVLFLELLLCFGWVNPLLFWYRRAIQLNHEFLADEAVNTTCRNVRHYQYLLLSKLTSSLTSSTPVQLSSTLTFQTTKQRLMMMTKQTSRAKAWLAGASAALLFGAVTVLLGTSSSAQVAPATSVPAAAHQQKRQADRTDMERLYGDKLVIMPNLDKHRMAPRKKFSELSAAEKERVELIPPLPKLVVTDALLTDWKNDKKYGIWIDGKRVLNNRLTSYTASDFGSYFSSKLEKNAINYGKHYFQINLMTNTDYARYLNEQAELPLLVLATRIRMKR